jgi:hypothetical protein
MFRFRPILATIVIAGCALELRAAEENFTPLFNGKDLSGWVNVNCAPSTWSVRDGVIVSTGKPTGVMRTDRHYENFILELEWKHLKKGATRACLCTAIRSRRLGSRSRGRSRCR